jgi:hypothetical protein
MSDTETPLITEEDRLVPRTPTGSMIARWLDEAADLSVERVEKMIRILERLRAAAIQQTYPSDWLIHVTVNHDGVPTKQVGYLQDCGAERAGKVFGIEIGKPLVERDELGEGQYMYRVQASAWSKMTGERIDTVLGARSSVDQFFQRQIKGEGDKVDPTDVMKAAYANLHGRAVRSLTGLTAVPLGVLDAASIDTKRCQYVGYTQGARGGESVGATTGGAEPSVAFGNSQGKKPSELTDKDLDWYIAAYEKNVADPKRERFVRANQHVLDALRREKDKRGAKAEHAAEGA